MSSLGEIVPKLYAIISEDKDKAITGPLNSIIQIMRDRSEANLPWAGISAQFLCNIIENSYSINIWKKPALDIFYDNNFFFMDFKAISKWRKIIDFIMVNDKAAFSDLLSSLFPSFPPSLSFHH